MLKFLTKFTQKLLQNHKNSHTLNTCKKNKLFSLRNYADSATFECRPFKLHRLEEGPPSSVEVTKEEAIKYYTQMQTIRRLETSAASLYKEKAIRGFCHLCVGQEAVNVGIKAAMNDNDAVITSYRAHGWTYLMGVSILGVLAELTGRVSGCALGKGGSMHMYGKNFYGGNGIVGAQVPLGAGIALAAKYKGNNAMCFALYGDGASNQGQVFESYNIAYLWKLPVAFTCENNEYGMGTSAKRSSSNTNYYMRGDMVPGLWFDGMDVISVREASRFAREYVLKNGPIVLEAYTYRYYGHSMSDPGISYRPREEVQEVRKTRDPIVQFKDACIKHELMTEDQIKEIDKKTRTEVDEIAEKSKKEPEPVVTALYTDIYSNGLKMKIRTATGYTQEHIQMKKGSNH